MRVQFTDIGTVTANDSIPGVCSANALYDAGRDGFLGGDNDWDSDHRLIFHDNADDTINLTTDDFLDDVAAAARVAVSGTIGSPTHAAGVADAADVTVNAVTGDQFEAIIIYQHTGTESTSDLVLAIDTATGLPCTPNGGNISVVWDNGANKIFKL